MTVSEYDFQIYKLSAAFYNAYPKFLYCEILDKKERPYNCIVFELSYDYFICIPYRTEINHQYAYHFRNSKRSVQHKSGLDYTKMVIVKNSNYLDTSTGIVDQDEYNETITNISRIKDEAFDFLEKYKNHITGKTNLHPAEFRRKYQFSPLQYFHSELGI